jgi:hypothetical protein
MLGLPVWELREACGVISGCTGFIGFYTQLGNCLTSRQVDQLGGRQEIYSGPCIRGKRIEEENYRESKRTVDIEELFKQFVEDTQEGHVSAELFDVSDLPKEHFPAPVSYCVVPQTFLFWAVDRGILLPVELQRSTGLFQIEKPSIQLSETDMRHLAIQATALIYWSRNPNHTIASIIRELKSSLCDGCYQVIRNAFDPSPKHLPISDGAAMFKKWKAASNKYKKYLRSIGDCTLRKIIQAIDPRALDKRCGRPVNQRQALLSWQAHRSLVVRDGSDHAQYDLLKLRLFLLAVLKVEVIHMQHCTVQNMLDHALIRPYVEIATTLMRSWIERIAWTVWGDVLCLEHCTWLANNPYPICLKTS